MSNDFRTMLLAHAAEGALVLKEGTARKDVIAKAKTYKGKSAEALAELDAWLKGWRMVAYAIGNVKGATSKNAIDIVTRQKELARDLRADWFTKADAAARNYSFHIRKEAGLIATDKRGGKRDGAGRKGATTKPETVASETVAAKPVADKPVADKPVADKPEVAADYKPATPRESAMFLRENIAALISIAKGARNSAAMIKALTACLAQAQAEIKNCE